MRKRRHLMHESNEDVPEFFEPERLMKESCLNPWNGECNDTDIALYIIYEGKRLPICRKCWEAISSKDIEWTHD